MEAIEYAFANLRSSNGLFYWGNHTGYDLEGDRVVPEKPVHILKAILPYYELMWQVNPEATKRLIESFWSAHVRDWKNLDMDRIGQFDDNVEEPWNHEYEEGPVFLPSGSGTSFSNAGTDLLYAAAMLTKLSGDKEPLVWAKRLAYRYVRTRHPKTGISYYMYKKPSSTIRDSYDSVMRKLAGDTTEFIPSEFPWFYYSNTLCRENPLNGMATPTPGVFTNQPVFYWQTQFLLGEMLAGEGNEFKQWALEEFTAFGKASYRKEDNVYVPILTDGTNIDGYVVKEDGLLGPKGGTLHPAPVWPSDLWAYAMGYRATKDAFIWEMARNISKGNRFGDIGAAPNDECKLNYNTNCANPYALLAFLELYTATGKDEFLQIAARIGDNIVNNRFHNGFFVASNEHTYAKFDGIDSLTLLRLHSALAGSTLELPEAWPSLPYFTCPYRWRGYAVDNDILYTRTESSEPPLSIEEAATVGDVELVRSLLDKGVAVDVSHGTGKTALQRAAMNDHKELTELLLDRGAGIDTQKGWPGGTPLHWAAEKGHRKIIELLIDKGADVNAKREGYPKGDTPLHSATRAGHKDIVELLIEKGADVNTKNNDGRSPIDVVRRRDRSNIRELLQAKVAETSIHGAASQGALIKLKAFIANGIDVDAKDEQGMTPLHLAAQEGHKKIVEYLLSKDADANAKNNDGKTPLDVAVRPYDKEITELLIEKGATISTIHIAAFVGNLERLQSFIEAGIDVNVKDETGMTPLFRAVSGGHADVVKVLFNAGADVNSGNKQGVVPLFGALWTRDSTMVELLLERGANVNAKHTQYGYTPLHWAVMMDSKEVVALLVARDAEVDAKDTRGRTPLDLANQRGHTEIVDLLRQHGAKEAQNNEQSLEMAILSNDLEKIKELISQGADVNVRDSRGNAPLHQAIMMGRLSSIERLLLIETLISGGADVNTKNGRRGATPLHLVVARVRKDEVELLIASGADLNAKDAQGQTPLDLAKVFGQAEIADILTKAAEKQGTVEKKASDGESPADSKESQPSDSLHEAAGAGDVERVRQLIAEGADVNAKD
ncbi:MAG: ankyrin repeat domain-containing protein, partial [Candidatus Thorarchaeota archaeon]